MTLQAATRMAHSDDREMFRDSVRKFFAKELTSNQERWEREAIVDRDFWRAAGAAGLLCPTILADHGWLGLANSAAGIMFQSDIVADHILNYGSEGQKIEWLPKMVSEEMITAIAMTECGTGSDMQGIKTTARREGNPYVVNSSKIYIANGQNADLVIVVAEIDAALGAKGVPLILVEATLEGSRGAATSTRSGNIAPIHPNVSSTPGSGLRTASALKAWGSLTSCKNCRRNGWGSPSLRSPAPSAPLTKRLPLPSNARHSAKRCSISRTRASPWRVAQSATLQRYRFG